MTQTDRRVAKIRAIIGADRARIDEIEGAVRELDRYYRHLDLLGRPSDWYKPSTKADKRKALSLARAVERLERILKGAEGRRPNVELRRVLTRGLIGEDQEFDEWRARLPHWRKRFEDFGGIRRPRPSSSLFFQDPVQGWPLGKPKPSAAKFDKKNKAAVVAAELLKGHGLPLTVTRGKSAFCKVAAVLYGAERGDLYHQCRTIREARNRGRS